MPGKIDNKFVYPKTKLNYSRSIERYLRTHTTNMLTGYIVPVGYLDCMPGDTVPNDFGFVLQSAPLLGPTVDNIYIDIVAVWCPTRLVLGQFNEWLGDSDTYAWTIPSNIKYPKITKVRTAKTSGGAVVSRSYLAEHCIGPHLGFRFYNATETAAGTDFTTYEPTQSLYHDGINVIPSRMYELIYNRIFRNENISNPITFSKQTGTNLTTDVNHYEFGLGYLKLANRLKNAFTTARFSPVIQSVDLGLGQPLPVVTGAYHSLNGSLGFGVDSTTLSGLHSFNLNIGSDHNGPVEVQSATGSASAGTVVRTNLVADLSQLTVNSMYYAIMLQKYYYKASNGRRPVEFYYNQFGIENSQAAFDDPQLLAHKRYKVNISRVIATGNSTDIQSNVQPLGTQGAYSITSVGGKLFPEFTTTEYGMVQIYAVIRNQESFATGIDKYLTHSDVLSTYLPVFDHIGDEAIESREFANFATTNANHIFGYQTAWYPYRKPISDVVGIVSPGEPLGYFSLAREFLWSGSAMSINEDFIQQNCLEFDRMLQFPVCYAPSGAPCDIDGEPYDSKRYQWIIQFALAGTFTRTMSKDSAPLLFK